MMVCIQRDHDFAVGGAGGNAVAAGQVDVVRQADVIIDDVQLVGRDHLPDVILNLLEIDLGLLDARARRAADMEAKLAGIHGGEEIAPHERVQEQG